MLHLVTAIIKPYKLDEVKMALTQAGVQGITVSEVRASAAKGPTETYRGAEYTIDFLPKVKIEVVCDAAAPEHRRRHRRRGRTGKIGDGKIFVIDLESVTRIRTGERGPDAV